MCQNKAAHFFAARKQKERGREGPGKSYTFQGYTSSEHLLSSPKPPLLMAHPFSIKTLIRTSLEVHIGSTASWKSPTNDQSLSVRGTSSPSAQCTASSGNNPLHLAFEEILDHKCSPRITESINQVLVENILSNYHDCIQWQI